MFGKTATRRVTVSRPAGLHARPCLAVSTAANRFQSKVEIRRGNQKADARSVLELLSLGAGQGTELVLSAKGPDAEEVLDELVRLFADNFGMPHEPDH